MQVIFCYTGKPDPIAEEAIYAFAPQAEFVETTGLFGYNYAISSRWRGKEDLLIIEGDKEITANVIPSLTDCKELWCIYEYWNYPEPYQLNTIYGLGCTRYSAKLQQQISTEEFTGFDPGFLRQCPYCMGLGCWNYLDTRIMLSIIKKGIVFDPHVHGRINHHHEYPPDWAQKRGLT